MFVGLSISQNHSLVKIKLKQKINGKFRDFDQNATYSKFKSIWSAKHDGSINSNYFLFSTIF